MNYRTANHQDIPSLVNMRIDFLMEDEESLTPENISILQQSISSHYTHCLHKNTIAFIAETNHEIIATVILVITERLPRVDSLSGKIGTLKSVYTKPLYRQQGIAKKLVLMAIEESKKLCLDFLDLDATKQGFPIYEKLGFKCYDSHYIPMRMVFNNKS